MKSVTVVSDHRACAAGTRRFVAGYQLEFLRGTSERVESIALSNDGRRVTSGCRDDNIRVWERSGEA